MHVKLSSTLLFYEQKQAIHMEDAQNAAVKNRAGNNWVKKGLKNQSN